MPNQLLRVEDGWMEQSVGLLPLSIQIAAEQRASIVAINDSIWVQHRHDSDHEVLSELFSSIGEKIGQKPIQHVRCLWLSGMDSARQDDSLLLSVIFHILSESMPKACEMRAGLQEMVFVIFKELLDLFLQRSLKKSLYSTFGLLSLLGQSLRSIVFLPECLFHDIWYLMKKSKLFVIAEMGARVLCDCDEWYWIPGQGEAKNVHLHVRLVLFCISQLEQAFLHLRVV